jgi:hypothetical protein
MRTTSVLARAVAAVLSVSLSGCTFFGWLIGRDVDHKARPRVVPPLQAASVEKGKRVELTLRDGSLVAGRFDGLEAVPPAVYRERWKESLQTLAPATVLPGLGAARIRTKAGREGDVTLLGVRPGELSFREGTGSTPLKVSLDSLASLSVPGGGAIEGATLSRLAQDGRLPFLDTLVVTTKDGARRTVPMESVRSATVNPDGRLGNKGALTGALIGLAIDAILVAVAVNEMNNTTYIDSSCAPNASYCTSCPTVYSDGKHGLRLDAEPLGGSLFAADEASDRAPLAQLEPKGGRYHVVIRNQMRELEHLDSVKLLVVDRPAGSEVVPAMDGSLHLLREARTPLRAVDATGANLAPELAREDGRGWIEPPLGRELDDPRSRRATAVVDFRRPPAARSEALLVSLRATEWGVALFGHVLGLQGRELDGFWTRLETDAAARRAFRAAWAREALPRIQLLTAHGWRDAGTLAHIPLLVTGRRVVPLDLRDVEGETLRLRIDALPGLWAIDAVAVDYEARPVSAVRTLSPRSARAADGADALGLLVDSDDRRLTLAATSGRVDLAFDAPAALPGAERSLLIELEGYYRPLVPVSGEPQTALFETLVHEPGALARYALAGVDASTRQLARIAAAEHAASR